MKQALADYSQHGYGVELAVDGDPRTGWAVNPRPERNTAVFVLQEPALDPGGTVLRVRAGMKPIATVPKALRTVDVATGDTASAHHQRSDVCAVPAAGVVAEAMVAIVLVDVVLEKFGGDSVAETRRNLEAYLAAIPEALRTADASDASLAQHDLAL